MSSGEKFRLESEIAGALDGRLSIFHLLWLALTIGGGAFLGIPLGRALAVPGHRALGGLGQYACRAVGFALGLAIAGFCARFVFGFVLWLGIRWLLHRKKQ